MKLSYLISWTRYVESHSDGELSCKNKNATALFFAYGKVLQNNVNRSSYLVLLILLYQGLCSYLLKSQPDIRSKGLVIGFDGRHNSHK